MRRGGFMDSFYSRGYEAGEWGAVYIPEFKSKWDMQEYSRGYKDGYKKREKRYKSFEKKQEKT